MDLYPPIEPYASGRLAVSDGHDIAWEQSGNPAGAAVLFLHGGPGAGTAPAYRRFFDPRFWRIVLFDQRGCGLSAPTASLEANTTAHLVADIEALRNHLGVDRWLVFGGSWGSTLAIAYGQAHPERISGFVLRGVFLFRPDECAWFMTGMGRFFPEAWRRFTHHLPESERGDLLGSYYRRLTGADSFIRLAAARAWCRYEESCARLMPRHIPGDMDDAACLAMARIECHYMVHHGFLAPDQLMRDLPRLHHLPCAIVQGRYDVVCPPATAEELARAWPGARLTVIPDAGHSAMEAPVRAALVAAVEGMKPLAG
jgi:proline iminopeptidase